MTATCERTWEVLGSRSPARPDTYRRHHCGQTGPHATHICRSCGQEYRPGGAA